MSAPYGGFGERHHGLAVAVAGQTRAADPRPTGTPSSARRDTCSAEQTFGVICSSAAMSTIHRLRPCVAAISS